MNPSFFDFDLYAAPESNLMQLELKGQGQRAIFIAYFGDDEQQLLTGFLKKIVQAAELKLEADTRYLSLTSKANFSLLPLSNALSCTTCIVFGWTPKELGLQFQVPTYQIMNFSGVRILFADALLSIYEERQAGGKAKSGALWNALKQLFLNT